MERVVRRLEVLYKESESKDIVTKYLVNELLVISKNALTFIEEIDRKDPAFIEAKKSLLSTSSELERLLSRQFDKGIDALPDSISAFSARNKLSQNIYNVVRVLNE